MNYVKRLFKYMYARNTHTGTFHSSFRFILNRLSNDPTTALAEPRQFSAYLFVFRDLASTTASALELLRE